MKTKSEDDLPIVTADRFTRLETLRKAAWESFSSRRTFEWKVNLSLWGLLAALIAGIASNRIDNLTMLTASILSVSAIVLGVSHVYWQVGVFNAHSIDKEEEGRFRDAMREELRFEDDPGLAERRNRAKEARNRGVWHWNIAPIACTTLVLVALTIIVAVEKSRGTNEKIPVVNNEMLVKP